MPTALSSFLAAAFLCAPGYPLARRILWLSWSQRLLVSIAVGSGIWPLALLWWTAAGASLERTAATILAWIVIVSFLILLTRDLIGAKQRRASTGQPAPSGDRSALFHVSLTVVVGMMLWTRVEQVAGLALPAWVDPIHHTMITRLILDAGTVPLTYDPYIPGGVAYYHWGFHACLAWLSFALGWDSPIEVVHGMLRFGQVVQVLIFLAVYASGRSFFSSRWTALLAATFATLLSWFPAYLTAWGRYTHLLGLVPLIGFLVLVFRIRDPRNAFHVAALSLCSAALALIHARLAILAATFAMVVVAELILRRRWRQLSSIAIAGATALLLTSPWLVRLASTPRVQQVVARGIEDSARDAPVVDEIREELLWAPGNLLLLITGTAGIAAFLILPRLSSPIIAWTIIWWLLVILAFHRRPREGITNTASRPTALLVAWCGATLLLVNLQWIGLPRIGGITNDSLLITLFLPLSLVSAVMIDGVASSLLDRSRQLVLAVIVIGVALAGGTQMLRIVSPSTVIATQADLDAIRWIEGNIPTAATVAIPVTRWLPDSFVGSDGGYWIGVLTHHSTIVPPPIYAWTMPQDGVRRLNSFLESWQLMTTGDSFSVSYLRERGVTHIFFGEASAGVGQKLQHHPELKVILEWGNVRVLEIRQPSEGRAPVTATGVADQSRRRAPGVEPVH